MEVRDVMRTTFTCRQFTDTAVSDAEIRQLLEDARFAPSGGNRQPWRVVVVRSEETKRLLADCAAPSMRVYGAQVAAGEAPWNTIQPSSVDVDAVFAQETPVPFAEFLVGAPVLLAIGADLSVIASFDSRLERVGVVSGASIYPFVWNLCLAARDRGLAGALTTMVAGREARAQALLGFPEHVAVAAVVPLGHPLRRLTKLRRDPVDAFTSLERFGGPPLGR